MSATLSSVHLPAVSPLWPRARRLLALALAVSTAIDYGNNHEIFDVR